jgi:hypothetical protein
VKRSSGLRGARSSTSLTMTDLIERIRRIIEQHREVDRDRDERLREEQRADASGVACGCRAEGLSDHPRHVAEEIVERLQLRPESNKVRNEIRYASAWFDDELTKLEGTE